MVDVGIAATYVPSARRHTAWQLQARRARRLGSPQATRSYHRATTFLGRAGRTGDQRDCPSTRRLRRHHDARYRAPRSWRPPAPAARHRASRRSPSTTARASRWTSRCCPTAASCTPPASRRRSGSTTPTPASTASPAASTSTARRGGPAEHRPGPRIRRQEEQLGLPLLLAAADTPVDDPATPASTRATHRSRAPRPTSSRSRAHPRSRGSSFVGAQDRPGTEQQIIDVPVDRGICCHVGGDIVFDSEGNLFLVHR